MTAETISYELKHPFEFELKTGDGEDAKTETVKVERVEASPPKGKHLRQISRLIARAENTENDYTHSDVLFDVIELVGALPVGAVDEMRAEDLNELGDLIEPFLKAAL